MIKDGELSLLDDPVIKQIAEKHSVTIAQVLDIQCTPPVAMIFLFYQLYFNPFLMEIHYWQDTITYQLRPYYASINHS